MFFGQNSELGLLMAEDLPDFDRFDKSQMIAFGIGFNEPSISIPQSLNSAIQTEQTPVASVVTQTPVVANVVNEQTPLIETVTVQNVAQNPVIQTPVVEAPAKVNNTTTQTPVVEAPAQNLTSQQTGSTTKNVAPNLAANAAANETIFGFDKTTVLLIGGGILLVFLMKQ